jgi:hypothetical protein
MDYTKFLEQFNEIKKKALFILNHKGYDVRLDTAVQKKDIIGLDIDVNSVLVWYDNAPHCSYQEFSFYEISFELIEMTYAELEAKFSANLKEYEEYKKMKKKFE